MASIYLGLNVISLPYGQAKVYLYGYYGGNAHDMTELHCIVFQVGLTVASIIHWPAVAEVWMPVRTENYVELYCNVPQMSLIMGSMLNLLLITACSILAFMARSLPDNFNESWYILLCVVTTLFIWVAFFTTYFSAFYAIYKAALLGSALILNSLVVIIAFFGPKIYAIAFIADKDIKITNFEGSMTRGGQSQSNMSVVSSTATDTTDIAIK